MRKIRKEIVLIAAVFLLLCVISLIRQVGMSLQPTEPVRPVVIYFIYLILLAGWWGSVRNRVTQRNMRTFLSAEAILMHLNITIRFIHDALTYHYTHDVISISQNEINLMRFSGYLHALPFVLVPLFGLYASFGLSKTEDYRFGRKWYLLLIPAGILSFLLLSNESHHLVFLPLQNEINAFLYFHPNTGIYVIFAWAYFLLLARVFVVYHRSREGENSPYLRIIPLAFTILLMLVNIPYVLASFVVEYELMEQSLLLCFLEIMVWESSILVGMVPVNTRYDEVFDRSTVAMLIVNEDGQTYRKASGAPELTPEMFEELKQQNIVRTPEGREMHLHPIRGGYAIWQNDISQTIAIIEELQKIAEKLEQDGVLLRQELAVRSDEASVREQNRIYNRLTDEVGEKLVLLSDLLEKREPVTDQASLFHKICLVGAYVKRRCNLRLEEQSDGFISNQELDLCYSELIGCLEQIGVRADVIWYTKERLAPEFAIFTFDVFELLLEFEHFELHSIQVAFETDAAFSVRVLSDSGSTRQIPVYELERINKDKYDVSWLSLENGYQVTVRE